MRLLLHRYGRFDHRPFGPAGWPHHDLLWVHEGSIALTIEGAGRMTLQAPDGVLLRPGARFGGQASGAWARASVCHFAWEADDGPPPGPGRPGPVLTCEAPSRADAGAAIRYALRLAQDAPEHVDRRKRLLLAVLDAFQSAEPALVQPSDPAVDGAWAWVAGNLSRVRTLADVAAAAGLSEPRFRARHRAAAGASAGQALRAARLAAAEHLLLTTNQSVAEIAAAVGYARPESLANAFGATRGVAPRAWRDRFRFA